MEKWELQIKKATVQYSGTCWECGEYVDGGDVCPRTLPPPPYSSHCPMRIGIEEEEGEEVKK